MPDLRSLIGHKLQLLREMRRVAVRTEDSFPRLLIRSFSLLPRFHPREALEMGLLDSRLSEQDRSACVAKRDLMALQARVNPPKLEFLTEDKAVFYHLCAGLGLPVPELYAVFAQPAGWARGRKGPVVGREQWEALFGADGLLPNAIVVKPAHGAYGRGVRVLERSEGGFRQMGGGAVSVAELYHSLASDPTYRKFVIQQRLYSHADLEQLSGVSSLQTVRAVTHVGPDGGVSILLVSFKVIVGDQWTDNYHQGRSGNLYAHVDPGSGRLDDAVGRGPNGAGISMHQRHPRTGLPFAGFVLPQWDAARSLLSRAALAMLPMRSIGWDVALTPEGPVLVEGNIWWDAPNELLLSSQGTASRREMAEVLGWMKRDARVGIGPRA